ncbi:MAG: hypothetical protein M3325_15830 [Actinomycetota bacterium]|nr:hypothetical protein [Actinomycetota bacterium]
MANPWQTYDIYLTASGIVLTIVFMAGLVFRSRRQYSRMAWTALPCSSSTRSASWTWPRSQASVP